MPTVKVNGISIHYERQGQGQPLLLIAGLGYDHWIFGSLAAALAGRFEVIVFDNRGAGRSAKPAGPYSAPMMAADTAGLIEALGLGPMAVFGHSMGGLIAQQLVLDRPDLVSHLILASTNFGGPNHVPVSPEALAVMLDTTSDPVTRLHNGVTIAATPGFPQREPELYSEIINYRLTGPVGPVEYQAQLAVGLGLVTPEAAFENKLHRVACPTLILFGEHDVVVPVANAALLADRIAGSQVQILPGCGHIFPLEAPAVAAAAIERWFDRVETQ